MEAIKIEVSIITPCYNSAATVSQTIESVLAQSFKNWELIVVDDASTDNTVDIINSYVDLDSRIRLIELSDNSGSPVTPRNVGLSAANGNIICFLDADDLWYRDKLEIQVRYMKENNCLFTYMPYDINFFDAGEAAKKRIFLLLMLILMSCSR